MFCANLINWKTIALINIISNSSENKLLLLWTHSPIYPSLSKINKPQWYLFLTSVIFCNDNKKYCLFQLNNSQIILNCFFTLLRWYFNVGKIVFFMLFKNFSQFAILSIMYDDFSKNSKKNLIPLIIFQFSLLVKNIFVILQPVWNRYQLTNYKTTDRNV